MKRLLFICAVVLLASAAHAQTPVGLSPVAKQQFLTAAGVPLSAGCLFTYATGTTTPQATYVDFTGVSQNTNPIILDSGGFSPSQIYLSASAYRFKLVSFGGTNCATGAQQWQVDGVTATNFLNLPNTWTALQAFSAGAIINGPGTINQTNAGVFTNTQMNEYLTSMLNGATANQFHTAGQLGFATEAIAAGVIIPGGATAVQNGNTFGAYVTTPCDSRVPQGSGPDRLGCNGVGYYADVLATGSHAAVWGSNLRVHGDGISNTNLTGFELDFGSSTCSFCQGISVNQGGTGTAAAISPVFLVHYTGGTFNMNQGYVVDRGGLAATGAGVLLDGNNTGGNNPSFPITFRGYDVTNTLQQASILSDLNGNLQFNPSTGNAYFFNKAGAGIGIPGSVSGQATLAAPSTGGVSSTLPSTAGTLTLTVASGTSAMTTALIGSLACGTTVTTSATGTLTTDAIAFSFNGTPPAGTTNLILQSWVTANNVNFQYCNPTAGNVTPSAATLNWRVTR